MKLIAQAVQETARPLSDRGVVVKHESVSTKACRLRSLTAAVNRASMHRDWGEVRRVPSCAAPVHDERPAANMSQQCARRRRVGFGVHAQLSSSRDATKASSATESAVVRIRQTALVLNRKQEHALVHDAQMNWMQQWTHHPCCEACAVLAFLSQEWSEEALLRSMPIARSLRPEPRGGARFAAKDASIALALRAGTDPGVELGARDDIGE